MAIPALGLKNSAAQGGIILEYHRIAKLIPDPHAIAVSPDHFVEHLEVIASRYAPTALDSMAKEVRAGKITPKSVGLSFDDGYADNLSSAKPILESQGIPATFFVTLGYVETQKEFWWDELERCLLESASLPPTLELRTIGKRYRRRLGDARGQSAQEGKTFERWDVSKKAPTARHKAYRELHALLRSQPPARRERTLDELRSSTGLADGPTREEYRPLTPAELKELDGSDLTDVGAHAMTHAPLAILSLEDQRDEVEGGKRGLEEILGRTVSLFSYPFGGKRDYTAKTRRVVEEAGYEAACASRPGRVLPSTDPFQLPRFQVYDWDGEHFERHMDRFFGL